MQSVQQARRGIFVFMVVLAATSFVSIWLRQLIPWPTLATVAFPMLMTALLSYSPAIACLIARMSLGEGIKDVSFRLRGDWTTQALLIAWLWPVLCGLGTYGIAWVAGFTRFAWTSVGSDYGTWGPENLLGLSIAGMPVLHGFALRLLASLVFSIIACLQSFGEELGWRGYLLTRLFDAKIPAPVFWNGLIWGLWHIPFALAWGPTSNLPERRSISLFFFVAYTVALAYLFSYLRLRSGSIWPAVLAHASGNTIFEFGFNAFTPASPFWIGELRLLSGALPVLLFLFLRRPWVIRYWPQHNNRDSDGGSTAPTRNGEPSATRMAPTTR
jgi:membrane protease YdiL (CAAX protease family)